MFTSAPGGKKITFISVCINCHPMSKIYCELLSRIKTVVHNCTFYFLSDQQLYIRSISPEAGAERTHAGFWHLDATFLRLLFLLSSGMDPSSVTKGVQLSSSTGSGFVVSTDECRGVEWGWPSAREQKQISYTHLKGRQKCPSVIKGKKQITKLLIPVSVKQI